MVLVTKDSDLKYPRSQENFRPAEISIKCYFSVKEGLFQRMDPFATVMINQIMKKQNKWEKAEN